MPQIYVEFSSNIKLVNFKEILKRINTEVARIVEVPPNRCKGRIIQYQDYLIGNENNPEEAFIFIQVAIQTSRSSIQKKQIGDAVSALLTELALPNLKEQKLKCSPRIEVRGLDYYLFSDWTS